MQNESISPQGKIIFLFSAYFLYFCLNCLQKENTEQKFADELESKKKYVMENSSITAYCPAANAIKLAILQGQYEAAKGANRVQLSLFYGIGKYISLNTRKGAWGTGALESISQILRRELPGLKGFSANSLKNMRKFYENWQMLDPNPTDEPKDLALLETGNSKIKKSKSTSTIVDLENAKSNY